MKRLILLLFASLLCLNTTCSRDSTICEDKLIYDDYVEAGSFTTYYDDAEYEGVRQIKVIIKTDSTETKKILDAKNSKEVMINDREMKETYPVIIPSPSRVMVYLVLCEVIPY